MLNYLPMRKFSGVILVCAFVCGPMAAFGLAQAAGKVPETAVARAQRGINLAASGYCRQALPLLAEALPRLNDKHLQYRAAMARAQCGMSLGRMGNTVEALAFLNREFPNDPQVLFVTAHYYSQMATQTARKLVTQDPTSAQAMELRAERYESEKRWDDAEKVFHDILAKYPDTAGIHYQLGRLLFFHGSKTADSKAEAEKEFEEELKVDPHSAATEFMLGDLFWEKQDWPKAIHHFALATKYDVEFAEAYLGLGVALNGAGKYAEAIAPLEKYVKAMPNDPAGHYQLAIAYARTGNMKDAQQQLRLQREAAQKAQKQTYRPADGGSPN
jgi:tetratricopeptide (TPR) repeat protein